MIFHHIPIEHRLALLDPDAYEFYYSDPWNLTVPAGETWYALNIWWATVNDVPWVFHRKLDVFDPYILSAGTNIRQPSGNPAFLYVCRPAKVAVSADPEAVLTRRLAALVTMPISLVSAGANMPAGAVSGAVIDGAFWEGVHPATHPPSFQKGMLRHASTHDTAWTALVGGSMPVTGAMACMNTLDEISDWHSNRITGNILCPFTTAMWTGIWARGANYAGDPTKVAAAGRSVITFNKLPSDW